MAKDSLLTVAGTAPDFTLTRFTGVPSSPVRTGPSPGVVRRGAGTVKLCREAEAPG